MSSENIFKEIEKEEKELDDIKRVIFSLKDKLLEKRPSHFSRRDIVNAFFGSLVVALTFVLKGALISTAKNLTVYHIEAIMLFTFMILTVEIYFIGYSRVKNKKERPFGQFLTKRLLTLYSISMIVSFFLVYLFNMNVVMGSFYNTLKLVIMVSMPSAIGAAVPNLLKQY